MNINDLEKLSKLQKQGIITDEEFEREKKKILSGNTNTLNNTKSRFNIKNFVLAFIIALIAWPFLYYVGIGAFKSLDNGYGFANVVSAIICLIISIKINSKKYKNTAGPFTVFIIILLFSGIGIWFAMYEFLQINDGLVELKE